MWLSSFKVVAAGITGLVDGVLAGDRGCVGRAITLVESTHVAHASQAASVVEALLPHSGRAHRVGITGPPGVGKSTLIETLGLRLVADGRRVAVLAVDPSSSRSGGSILGDKTRMRELSLESNAFIRPSPASGALGGVARTTREAMVVLEAAGHDVVLVETVGVGQSETLVTSMVDFFLVLVLAGAGDELQGIKKGILESANMVAVNKADGDNVESARRSAADYRRALSLTAPESSTWTPRVVTCSGRHGNGLKALWEEIERHRELTIASGEFAQRRRAQAGLWMRTLLHERLLAYFDADPALHAAREAAEANVVAGLVSATHAVDDLIALLNSPKA